MTSNIDHFEQFRRNRREGKAIRAKNEETVSLLLSNFGNDVYNCNDKFFEQGIEFKDLASLTREDLKLFGIKDYELQTEMLETFSQLTKQEYSLKEIKITLEGQKYNSQIIGKAYSFLESMKMSSAAANLKLKLKPSGLNENHVILDEKNFASKFVIDALNELQNVTTDIEKNIESLEEICCENLKINAGKSNRVVTYLKFGTLTVLCVSFVIWKLR